MPKSLKEKNITVTFLALASAFLMSGCGLQTKAPATVVVGAPAEEQELFRAATSSTNPHVIAMQAKLATIKSDAQACIQDPACLNKKIDELSIALSNRLLSGYSTVRLGLAGGTNQNGKASAGYAYRLLTNNGTGFVVASSSGQVYQSTPISGRSIVAAAVTAAKVGVTPYAGAGLIYVDVNVGTIAIAGADIYGYSYCYVVSGVAPLCYSAGW